MKGRVLSLCDRTGNAVRDWARTGGSRKQDAQATAIRRPRRHAQRNAKGMGACSIPSKLETGGIGVIIKGGQGRSARSLVRDGIGSGFCVCCFLAAVAFYGIAVCCADDKVQPSAFEMSKDGPNVKASLRLTVSVPVADILKRHGDFSDKDAQREMVARVVARLQDEGAGAVAKYLEQIKKEAK